MYNDYDCKCNLLPLNVRKTLKIPAEKRASKDGGKTSCTRQKKIKVNAMNFGDCSSATRIITSVKRHRYMYYYLTF